MPSYKMGRINEDVRRELCDILPNLKDPRIRGMLSVVSVDVTNDLSLAKIYVSSLGGMEDTKESLKGLKAATGYIRRELANRMSLRKVPELKFIADDGIARSAYISGLLIDLEKGAKHDEP